MDRIILGKAPANNNLYYGRSANVGLFISKESKNVMSCPSSDLLFDTTVGFIQILETGKTTVGVASGIGIGQEGTTNVYTTVTEPHSDASPVLVSWNSIVTSANAHPSLGGTLYGGTVNDDIEVTSSFSSIGTQFIDDINSWRTDEEANKINPRIGLVCETFANTTYTPSTIDLVFRNGSTVNEQLVFYTLYREKGT